MIPFFRLCFFPRAFQNLYNDNFLPSVGEALCNDNFHNLSRSRFRCRSVILAQNKRYNLLFTQLWILTSAIKAPLAVIW